MNLNYLNDFFTLNKMAFIDSEFSISSYDDLLSYILDLVSFNILLDYGVNINLYKLFDIEKEK